MSTTDFQQKPSAFPYIIQEKTLDKKRPLWYNTQALRKCVKYRGVEQLEARRAHNPEVVGSSPASATIRKDSPSSDSESFFAYLQHSYLLRSIRFYSVLVCSIWAANRAARAKIRSFPWTARRRHDNEIPLKFPIPQCISHTRSSVSGSFCCGFTMEL